MGGSNTSEGVQILQYMPEVSGPGGVQFFRDRPPTKSMVLSPKIALKTIYHLAVIAELISDQIA